MPASTWRSTSSATRRFPSRNGSGSRARRWPALQAERDSAEARTYRGLLRALYGPDHPYRLPIDGAEATVAPLVRDDLEQFHHRYHGPGQAAWIVAGDVDPDRLAAGLDQRLAGLDRRGGRAA